MKDTVLFTADGKNSFCYSPVSGRKLYVGYDYNSLPYIEDFSQSDRTITAVYDAAPPYLTMGFRREIHKDPHLYCQAL